MSDMEKTMRCNIIGLMTMRGVHKNAEDKRRNNSITVRDVSNAGCLFIKRQ